MFRSIIRSIIWLQDYDSKKTVMGKIGSYLFFWMLFLIAMFVAAYAFALFVTFFQIPIITGH